MLRQGWAQALVVLWVEGGGEDFRLIAEADIQTTAARENYVSIYIYFDLEKLRKEISKLPHSTKTDTRS